jgi:hypothetical protein
MFESVSEEDGKCCVDWHFLLKFCSFNGSL